MDVRLAEEHADLERVGRLLLQLRPSYDLSSIVAQIKAQQKNGYHVAYIEENSQVLCAAGFVIAESLAWGKHIYIADLVTDRERQSTGVGKTMMNWLKSHAKENGCTQIHLDSGVQRFPAHKFYLREGFSIASHHFSIVDINE